MRSVGASAVGSYPARPDRPPAAARGSSPIVRSKLLVALLLAFGLAVTPVLGVARAFADELPPGGTFLDDDGNVHEGYIEALVREEITRGCADGRYCPPDEVTRGQMAAFLARALGLPASSTDYFTDDAGHLFEADINALADAGITHGCGDGTGFCPDAHVTRGEMAAFLRRAGELPATDDDRFSDDEDSVFEDDIDAIAAAGITSGCNPPDNTRFCPGATTKRSQMASFLGRFLELEPTPPPERDPSDVSVDDAIRAWFSDIYDQAVSVAECESSRNPNAVNPAGYHGLFQIGESSHRSAFERVTGQAWNDDIYTAYYNAQYARDLYDRSGGWGPWGCKP